MQELAMKDLVDKLNYYTKCYDEGHPIISDEEWDNLYFELVKWEKSAGIFLADSPTQKINYKVVNVLEKVTHNHSMLSLDKTKDVHDIKKFLGDNPYIAMCKMDGLTCSLTYENGRLIRAETRGNGTVGENILHNAFVIKSIPKKINYKDTLIVDGEIICDLKTFNDNFSDEYENHRNFSAGSIRLLDSKECEKRKLTFVAWDVIEGLNTYQLERFHLVKNERGRVIRVPDPVFGSTETLSHKLTLLEELGFIIVPWSRKNISIEEDIERLKSMAEEEYYPIDGIVFRFNNIEYANSLGATAHHFKHSIAYKFYDEEYETTLIDIEFSMGRTGILTPIAIFEPVEIDGTITRASLHNIDIMENILGKNPYKGQKIFICKQNMIIPQVVRAEQPDDIDALKLINIPNICPMCGESTKIITSDNGVRNLYCSNPNCNSKLINQLKYFTGKKGLDIKGLSTATLEKLVEWGWVEDIYDIFFLKNKRQEWEKKQGFGEKSVSNILDAIENSRECTLDTFISSLGIPLIGSSIAKEICKHINSWYEFIDLINNKFDFSRWDTFGDEKTKSLWNFDYTIANILINEKIIIIKHKDTIKSNEIVDKIFNNRNFVITGKLQHFKNRDELITKIESLGGKVASSVTKKTNYLINNDKMSSTSKNLTAQKLNIPIISEEEFLNMI